MKSKFKLLFILISFVSNNLRAAYYFDETTKMLMYKNSDSTVKVNKRFLSENRDSISMLKSFLGDKGYSCLRANNFELSTAQLNLCEFINNFKEVDVISPTNGHCALNLTHSNQEDNFFGNNASPKECFSSASQTTIPDSLLKVMNPELKLQNINLTNQAKNSKTYSERKQENLNKCICNAYEGSEFCDTEKTSILYTNLYNCHELPACENESSINCNRLNVKSGFDLSEVRRLVESAKENFISISPGFETQNEYKEILLKYKQEDSASSSEDHFAKVDLKLKDAYSKLFDDKLGLFLKSNGCNSNLDNLIKDISANEVNGAINESILGLIDQLELDLKNGDDTYESRSMLRYLKLLTKENQKNDFKTAQRFALERLAPRLQWAYLWGDEQIAEEDERYIDEILTKLTPKEVEDSLKQLNEFVSPDKWRVNDSSNPLNFLKSTKDLPRIQEFYKKNILKLYSTEIKEIVAINTNDIGAMATKTQTAALVLSGLVGLVGAKALGIYGKSEYDNNRDKLDSQSLRDASNGLHLLRISNGIFEAVALGEAAIAAKTQAGGAYGVPIATMTIVLSGMIAFEYSMNGSAQEQSEIDKKLKAAEAKEKEEKERQRILKYNQDIDVAIKKDVDNYKKHKTEDINDHVDPKQGKELPA